MSDAVHEVDQDLPLADRIKEVRFDAGPLASAVRAMLASASLDDIHVQVSVEKGLGGNDQLVLRHGRLASQAWSTGERLLWEFVVAAGGRGEVNLQAMFARLGRSALAPYVVAVVAAGMGEQ